MAAIRISESEAVQDFRHVMARVREGLEVVIEVDARPVARLFPAQRREPGRLLSEMIASAEARGSNVTLDEGFSKDLEEVIASREEPLGLAEWD
jgi:antitoxin (DNA-binding transcriptional repressor) of toxin-antitoxin stability system